VTVHMLHRSHL